MYRVIEHEELRDNTEFNDSLPLGGGQGLYECDEYDNPTRYICPLDNGEADDFTFGLVLDELNDLADKYSRIEDQFQALVLQTASVAKRGKRTT